MRKIRIIISVIAVVVMICLFSVGCKIASIDNPLKELNASMENTSQVSGAKIKIEVKAGSELVYSERTEYKVKSSEVEYSTIVKKPSTDIWQKDDLSESVSEGVIQKSEFLKILPCRTTITESDVDGEITKNVLGARAVYEFTLHSADKFVGEEAKNVSANVEMRSENDKITYVKIEYSLDGYKVEKIYELDN